MGQAEGAAAGAAEAPAASGRPTEIADATAQPDGAALMARGAEAEALR